METLHLFCCVGQSKVNLEMQMSPICSGEPAWDCPDVQCARSQHNATGVPWHAHAGSDHIPEERNRRAIGSVLSGPSPGRADLGAIRTYSLMRVADALVPFHAATRISAGTAAFSRLDRGNSHAPARDGSVGGNGA